MPRLPGERGSRQGWGGSKGTERASGGGASFRVRPRCSAAMRAESSSAYRYLWEPRGLAAGPDARKEMWWGCDAGGLVARCCALGLLSQGLPPAAARSAKALGTGRGRPCLGLRRTGKEEELNAARVAECAAPLIGKMGSAAAPAVRRGVASVAAASVQSCGVRCHSHHMKRWQADAGGMEGMEGRRTRSVAPPACAAGGGHECKASGQMEERWDVWGGTGRQKGLGFQVPRGRQAELRGEYCRLCTEELGRRRWDAPLLRHAAHAGSLACSLVRVAGVSLHT